MSRRTRLPAPCRPRRQPPARGGAGLLRHPGATVAAGHLRRRAHRADHDSHLRRLPRTRWAPGPRARAGSVRGLARGCYPIAAPAARALGSRDSSTLPKGDLLRLRLLAAPISCLALAVGLAACGGGGDEGGDGQSSQAPGNSLTIYSSLPLQGTSRGQSEAVIAGEKAGAGQARARQQDRQLHDQVRVARRLHRPEPGHRRRGPDGAERAPGGVGQVDDLLPRRVQLRRQRRSRSRSSTRPGSRRSARPTPTSA